MNVEGIKNAVAFHKGKDILVEREVLEFLVRTIEHYESALKEITSEECQYKYCGAEYIAKEALKGD